ncbi:MAG: YCF48-related protein, partial [Thermostichus sp. DG_1_5_bins_95]
MFKPLRMVLLFSLSLLLMAARMPSMRVVPWQQVQVPTENILLDIAFTGSDGSHGWLVGDKATLLESQDGGLTWQNRNLTGLEPEAYLSSISFAGPEGWIVGQPKVL